MDILWNTQLSRNEAWIVSFQILLFTHHYLIWMNWEWSINMLTALVLCSVDQIWRCVSDFETRSINVSLVAGVGFLWVLSYSLFFVIKQIHLFSFIKNQKNYLNEIHPGDMKIVYFDWQCWNWYLSYFHTLFPSLRRLVTNCYWLTVLPPIMI